MRSLQRTWRARLVTAIVLAGLVAVTAFGAAPTTPVAVVFVALAILALAVLTVAPDAIAHNGGHHWRWWWRSSNGEGSFWPGTRIPRGPPRPALEQRRATMTTPAFALYQLDGDLTRQQVIAELDRTPSRATDLLADLDAEGLLSPGVNGAWSPIETCRHIRDILQVYGMRFKWIILQDDPFLPNYDEGRWVAASPDGPAEVDSMLHEMEAYRGETVRLLTALSSDGWARRGRHEILGSIELEAYVRHELAHERQHLAQLARSVG